VPPLASIVVQGASVVLLAATAVLLVLAFRRRHDAPRTRTRLETVQTGTIVLAAVGLGLSAFVDTEVVDALWVVGVFATLAIAVARWRRREPVLPFWF
jgi:hydrogenase-4 membrane subunit HyfE